MKESANPAILWEVQSSDSSEARARGPILDARPRPPRGADARPAPAPITDEGPLGAEALFRRHAGFVAGFLARLGCSMQEVDDLVQEVFLTAHRRGGYVPGPARPTTWLAEIAMRVASTARRTRRRRPAEPDDGAIDAVAGSASPFDDAANAEALARVQLALDALDLDRRAIFVLFELEGESCDAIAAALGVPVGTVYSRLHAARQEFRAAYERLAAPRTTPRRAEQGAP